MSWRGVFSGALLLTGLQAVVSSKESAARWGGLVGSLADITRHALSPFEPLIPDLRDRTLTPTPPPPPPPRRDPTRPRPAPLPGQGSGDLRA
jgi:hypothetical protein